MMLSAFLTCYLWWFLAGALLGWLLNWLLCKCSCQHKTPTHTQNIQNTQTTVHTHSPASSTIVAATPTSNPHVTAHVAPLASLSQGHTHAEVKPKPASPVQVEVTATTAAQPEASTVSVPSVVSTLATVAVVTREPAIDLVAAKAAGFSVKGADDLQVIEGIGPKICALFHAAGHKTFTQVSKLSIADMAALLDHAGARFKLANPETWAQQAALAAHNQWADLRVLQDSLTAGVTVQQDRSEL
jgi:predicted flap endonuclease-1-like 5' DNA nuclease